MNKCKALVIMICIQFSFLNLWGQGFGKQELMNDDWFFKLGDQKEWSNKNIDHSQWRKLDLPHDWSKESAASPEYASCTGYLPGGIGWYRKEFKIPANNRSKRTYVYFEGVYNNSEVFVNGKWVGKRPNGYVSFLYDLTPYLSFDGNNTLAIRVDHTQYADSRWYTGSGIYRNVYLVTAEAIHIREWGVSCVADVKEKNAQLTLQTELINKSKSTSNIQIIHEIFSPNNKRVATQSADCLSVPDSIAKNKVTIDIANPELWSLENPALYTIRTRIYKNGKLLDEAENRTGIRTLTFDADKGFALNGKFMKVKGVCIHHDAGCLGAAVPKEVWRRRLMQLKKIGCNAIRMSHNPQSPCVYDLCDELGILVNNEAFDEWEYPKKKWISGWNKGKPGFQGPASYFLEWGKKDLADMVRRDRNHPSVIMWSIGNEVDYPNDPYSHPILDKEGIGQQHVKGYLKDHPHAERLGDIARELAAEVKKYDQSRPVTAALAGAVMSNETEYPAALDIVGYNYTENRYLSDHQKYPKRIFYGSETRHDLDAWKAVRDNPFIFGQFIWTGFDYLGEAGPWPSRGFTTGLIDLAGNIKPGGFFRRSLWLETPTIYLGTYKTEKNKKSLLTNAPATWNYKPGEEVRVVTYTNCEEAELYLNGQLIGQRKPYDPQTGIIYWDVPFSPGTLEVVGYNRNEQVSKDSLFTVDRPYAIKASLDKTKNIKDGECVHLEIQIVDKNGHLVPMADNDITCKLEGNARLLGLESGSNNASDNFRDNRQMCKKGRLTGYILVKGRGELIVNLTSPSLKSAILKIDL